MSEREYIEQLLARSGGSASKAAVFAGVSNVTFIKRMRENGIEPNRPGRRRKSLEPARQNHKVGPDALVQAVLAALPPANHPTSTHPAPPATASAPVSAAPYEAPVDLSRAKKPPTRLGVVVRYPVRDIYEALGRPRSLPQEAEATVIVSASDLDTLAEERRGKSLYEHLRALVIREQRKLGGGYCVELVVRAAKHDGGLRPYVVHWIDEDGEEHTNPGEKRSHDIHIVDPSSL